MQYAGGSHGHDPSTRRNRGSWPLPSRAKIHIIQLLTGHVVVPRPCVLEVSMAIARFTEAWVRGAPEGQYTDGTLPGFMCVVGKTRTTWYAQANVRGGRQTKVRVGHWPDVPQAEARRMAADALAA